MRYAERGWRRAARRPSARLTRSARTERQATPFLNVGRPFQGRQRGEPERLALRPRPTHPPSLARLGRCELRRASLTQRPTRPTRPTGPADLSLMMTVMKIRLLAGSLIACAISLTAMAAPVANPAECTSLTTLTLRDVNVTEAVAVPAATTGADRARHRRRGGVSGEE